MNIKIQQYNREEDKAVQLIKDFWRVHSNYNQNDEEAKKDLRTWADEGHKFYFILKDNHYVGFIHMGNRGARIDWLEDLFVLPDYQNQGIGTYAIKAIEEEVKTYSDSLYIEAAARNKGAIMLYRKLGYNCLNSITIRKDFNEDDFNIVRTEKIYDVDFQIRKVK